MIRRLALLATSVALLIPVAAATAAPDPTALPKGDAPAVAWQAGTTVHTASGRRVKLPFGKAGDRYEVLGKRRGEWIVAVPGYDHARVLAVKGNKVRTVWKHVYDESSTDYVLAAGGSLVAEWNHDRAGATTAVVINLAGKVVARHSWGGSVDLLDFAGDTMLIRRWADNTQLWSVPGKPVTVAPDAEFGDLDGDLLWVTLPQDFSGPTSLSAPGVPAWSSNTFIPVRLSPDGQYIAGLSYTGALTLEVRRIADGSVLPLPPFTMRFDSAMAWEPGGSLLAQVKSGPHTRALVRCTLTGVCERATGWVKGQTLGFPG